MDTLEDIWDYLRDAVPGDVVGAIVILVVGWFVAWLISKVVVAAVRRTGLGRRLGGYLDGGDAQAGQADASGAAGRVVFYLIMLFVVIAVLDRLQLRLATEPLNDLLAGIFAFIPNLIGAAILALLAWILARILRTVVFQLSRTLRLDERLRAASEGETEPATNPQSTSAQSTAAEPTTGQATAARGEGGERFPLARGLGEVAYALVFLLFLPAILDALQLGGLLEPVNELLNTVLGFIPNLVAAGLILVISWFIARFVSRLVSGVLAGAGFNRLPARLGFAPAAEGTTAPGGWTPSRVAGALVLAAVMWFAALAALEILGLASLTVLLAALLVLAGRILLGLLIIAVGLWLARLAARAIRGSGVQQPNLIAFAAQAAILVLVGAMGLRQMGVADSIINLAFAILLGAIGIASAIAFGVGGRGVAGRLLDRWVAGAQTGELDRAAREATEGESAAERGLPPA